MLITIGPRQITGDWSSRKNPIEMSCTPYFSTGWIFLFCPARGTASVPIMSGMLGPYTSASSRPTVFPNVSSASARFTASVDLPTPPFPLATARMRRTSGMSARSRTARLPACGVAPAGAS